MTETDERNLSDLSFIIEGFYDDIGDQLSGVSTAVSEFVTFYEHPMYEKDEQGNVKVEVWHYEEPNQEIFRRNQKVLSRATSSMYPVLRDINETFKISQEKLEEYSKPEEAQNPVPTAPIIIAQQGQQQQQPQQKAGWYQKIFGKGTEFPDSLKDAWAITKDMQTEIINIKNLWKQLLAYHQDGMGVQVYLKSGNEPHFREERDFFMENIEPEIDRLVQQGSELMKLKRIKIVSDSYIGTVKRLEEEEKSKAFSQRQ